MASNVEYLGEIMPKKDAVYPESATQQHAGRHNTISTERHIKRPRSLDHLHFSIIILHRTAPYTRSAVYWKLPTFPLWINAISNHQCQRVTYENTISDMLLRVIKIMTQRLNAIEIYYKHALLKWAENMSLRNVRIFSLLLSTIHLSPMTDCLSAICPSAWTLDFHLFSYSERTKTPDPILCKFRNLSWIIHSVDRARTTCVSEIEHYSGLVVSSNRRFFTHMVVVV